MMSSTIPRIPRATVERTKMMSARSVILLQSMVAITIAEIMKIPPISGVLGFSGWSSMRGDICTQCTRKYGRKTGIESRTIRKAVMNAPPARNVM